MSSLLWREDCQDSRGIAREKTRKRETKTNNAPCANFWRSSPTQHAAWHAGGSARGGIRVGECLNTRGNLLPFRLNIVEAFN